MIKKEGYDKMLGLMVVYVDDFLIATAHGAHREELKKALSSIWDMCDETLLAEWSPLKFVGLELECQNNGIKVHQATFINMILVNHGFDKANGIQAISMETPSEETAPTAVELKHCSPMQES